MAIDVDHFIKLLRSLGASDSLDLSAHEAGSCGVISLAGALDRTLMKFGECASPSRLTPAVIGRDDILTTDQMLDKCYDLRGTRQSLEQDSNKNDRNSKRVQYVGSTSMDCSGTKTEQSVRNVTLAAGLAIGESPAKIKTLKEIEARADNPIAMRSLIEASSADVQRVLLWAEAPAPLLAGHVDVSTVNTIGKSYRAALLGDDPASKEPSAKHIKVDPDWTARQVAAPPPGRRRGRVDHRGAPQVLPGYDGRARHVLQGMADGRAGMDHSQASMGLADTER